MAKAEEFWGGSCLTIHCASNPRMREINIEKGKGHGNFHATYIKGDVDNFYEGEGEEWDYYRNRSSTMRVLREGV